MQTARHSSLNSQSGFFKFWAFITGIMFAALAWVLTQFGMGDLMVDKQTWSVVASKVTQHPANIRTQIGRMVLEGMSPNSIVFTGRTAEFNSKVFETDGGEAVDAAVPGGCDEAKGGPDGTVRGVWGYKDITDPALGYYIKDVGTNTNVSGREAFAYLHGIPLAVCEQINKGFGLSGIEGQSDKIDYALNGGKGDSTYDPTDNVFTAYPAHAFACFENPGGSGTYDYYHALIER